MTFNTNFDIPCSVHMTWTGHYWQLCICQFIRYNNFFWLCLFLAKNQPIFLSLPWKLDNPYYHNVSMSGRPFKDVKMWIFMVLYHNYLFFPILSLFRCLHCKRDHPYTTSLFTGSRGQERLDSFDFFKPVHTVSFDWFLSGLEWILNLEFCSLKLLIFYQKLS